MSDSSGLPTIGFIGVGNMGAPMAERLLAAGYRVVAYDVSPDAGAAIEANGGALATSAPLAAAGSDVVILMLPNSTIVRSVVAEPEFLDSLRPGTILVDMGSSQPLSTRELAALVDEYGALLLDAPVSGGVQGAQAGKLTIMVGGPRSAAGALQPVFDVLGSSVHAGPVGAGHAIKALNNLLSALHLWATSEAMVVGTSFGLDPEVMLRVFNASSGRSGSTENKWPNYILTDRYDSGFGLSLMIKDMKIATALADQVGRHSDLADQVVELWELAEAGLGSQADHTEVASWIRDRPKSVD